MQTTFICKLWKLQFGPLDQDPREAQEEWEGGFTKV